MPMLPWHARGPEARELQVTARHLVHECMYICTLYLVAWPANKSGIMMIRSSQKKREREEEGSRAIDS